MQKMSRRCIVIYDLRRHAASNISASAIARSPSGKRLSLFGEALRPPFLGNILTVEEGATLPDGVPESLTVAGFDVVRAATVERACILLGHVFMNALIVCLGPRGSAEHRVRTGLEVLPQLPRDRKVSVVFGI
jgi:hypothetical protein